MMILGLMLIALICLVVGLVLPSSAWLIASLIATAGSGYLLWKLRSTVAPGSATASSIDVLADDAREIEPVPDAPTVSADELDSDDRPTQSIPAVRVEPVAAPTGAPTAAPGDVWVIDGRPRYHAGNCPIIQGQDAEPVPFDQATEDGFMPCSLCEPHLARTDH